jgi:hypothetical protein
VSISKNLLAQLGFAASLAAVVASNAAGAADCVDGGRIANEAVFSDGSVVHVLERTSDTLRYESGKPGNPPTTLEVRNVMFTQSVTGPNGVARFTWTNEPKDLGPLRPGMQLSASGVIKNDKGQEAPIVTSTTVGEVETVAVDGCPFPTVKLTVDNTVNGRKSRVIRYYHEKSMLTLKTIAQSIVNAGEAVDGLTFTAVSLK